MVSRNQLLTQQSCRTDVYYRSRFDLLKPLNHWVLPFILLCCSITTAILADLSVIGPEELSRVESGENGGLKWMETGGTIPLAD